MVLPPRGLTGQRMGLLPTEQPLGGEEGIRPADVLLASAVSPATLALAQQTPQPAADQPVDATERPAMTVLEVLKPAPQRSVQRRDDRRQRVPARPSRLRPDRLLELRQA